MFVTISRHHVMADSTENSRQSLKELFNQVAKSPSAPMNSAWPDPDTAFLFPAYHTRILP
jgi:hypothetical protein